MGFGEPKSTNVHVDMMESSIVDDPHSNALKFRNEIYKYVISNRDILGYPKGTNTVPYMFMSNDLSGIFIEFMQLLDKYKNIHKIKVNLVEILKYLILSYDDTKCNQGCCGFWHSIDKEIFVTMHNALNKTSIELGVNA